MIGSRRLMDTYDIQLPSMEYERRHTVNQRRVIYLAVSGKLFSMFQVAYQSDPDTAAVLDSLRRAGLSLIVDCDDFNCDEALLQTAYNLPVGTVKVLSGKEHKALEPLWPGCRKAKAVCCTWAALPALSAAWKPLRVRQRGNTVLRWCCRPRCSSAAFLP